MNPTPNHDDVTTTNTLDLHDEDDAPKAIGRHWLPQEQDINEALKEFTFDTGREFADEDPQAILAEIQQDLRDHLGDEIADCPRCMAYMLCYAGIFLTLAREQAERELASRKAIEDAVEAARVKALNTMPATISRGKY